jgi:hypothetical protein
MTRPELASRMLEFLARQFLDDPVHSYWRKSLKDPALADGEIEAAAGLAASRLAEEAVSLSKRQEDWP